MPRAFVTGLGIVTPAGAGIAKTLEALKKSSTYIKPLGLFKPGNDALPVGECSFLEDDEKLPRTHKLAMIAAKEALGDSHIPDAVVLGCTTGGVIVTEDLLRKGEENPELFKYHGTGTVADYIADQVGCKGQAFTVSTACSSGALALKIALQLIRSGEAKSVLAGGVDSLSMLTYYGFSLLQLIDPDGSRPFDKSRGGMSVAEGAGLLLLEACDNPPENAYAELSGAGASCDAYHPTKPHPEGEGAYNSMISALTDANVAEEEISYINLHGTGTRDNDLSEAMAIKSIFGEKIPPLSSCKGLWGHPLAAAGGVEAVVSCLCIRNNLLPQSLGFSEQDPDIGIDPIKNSGEASHKSILSNSFGFGGNNSSLVFSNTDRITAVPKSESSPLSILGYSCITGAGHTEESVNSFLSGENTRGILDLKEVSKDLNPRAVRRIKRLQRLALALADSAYKKAETEEKPDKVFFSTGWGPLSETYDFLKKLYDSGDKFSSPIDFVGSVHNAPASQIAMMFKAKSANITGTGVSVGGADYSFAQTLNMASLLSYDSDKSFFLVGADQAHEKLTDLFNSHNRKNDILGDGGGAFLLQPVEVTGKNSIKPLYYASSATENNGLQAIVDLLGDSLEIGKKIGAIMVDMSPENHSQSSEQLQQFLALSKLDCPVIDYKKTLGNYASVSAVGAVMSHVMLTNGNIPSVYCQGSSVELGGKSILNLGLGKNLTAFIISKN